MSVALAPTMRRRRAKRHTDGNVVSVLALLLLSIVPYLNSLPNSFVYDDRFQVLNNPYAHSFRYLGKIFGSTVWTFQGAQGVSNYYRPLMTLEYLVCYKLFGPVPFGFHLVSIALYATVVLLLFALSERLFGDPLLSVIAAGLFALHPVHTESTAWIAGVNDLELGVAALLVFLCYLRLENAPPRRLWFVQTCGLAAYILALLSKEQALVLPPLLVVYEHFYRPDRGVTSLRVKAGRYAPVCVAAAGYLAFRHFALGGFAPSVARPDLSWRVVLLTAVALTGAYLWKLIWPLHLSAFYVFHESDRLRDPHVLGGIAGIAICIALFAWMWRRHHAISFAVLWMGATIAPVLNARWMPAAVFADRYLFLPSMGFCWLAGWAASSARRATKNAPSLPRAALAGAVPAAIVLVAVLYGIRTVRRNADWRTEETLYRQTLREQPDAQLIRTNLGAVLWDRGDEAGAEREWLESLGPHDPYAITLNNLGMLRAHQKRYDEATDYFDQAMDERPLYMEPHKNLSDMYVDMGRDADAERELRTAIALSPLSVEAHNAYGDFLLDRGRPAEAQQQFAASVRADDNAEAEENLGDILAKNGDTAKARDAYRAAIALDNFNADAYFGIAALDEQAGNNAEAMREYRIGLNTDPNNADALAAMRRLAAAGQR
jgi:Tfp pilus assembly protein PilF